MRNIFKQEGVFISGTLLLALLIAGSSYAARQAQDTTAAPAAQSAVHGDAVVHTSPVEISTSTPSAADTTVTSTPPPTPKPAPSIRYRVREYDDD